uniref:RING-type domain-containing protein n=1 Tax=Nothobranchius pienaari TaxID=704102 RepID=A0A1A8LH55_9TELE
MDVETFVLFRGGKRVTMNGSDMTVDKICRIFQVTGNSLYITDDMNTAIFPDPSGNFTTLSLQHRGHYEVHGDSEQVQSPPIHASATSRSNFPPRQFQRSVHIAEIVNDKLTAARTVVIRFLESDATVERMTVKVKEALGCVEEITLTDSQGNEIVDSEGTRSSSYWKQNSRKIYAIFEDDFVEFQNGRRQKTRRRSEETGILQEVLGKIDELKQATETLQNATEAINLLSDLAKVKSTTARQAEQLHLVMDAFCCHVCKSLMSKPMFSTCCQSLLGCQTCVEHWLLNTNYCLKCRAEDFEFKVHEVKGLSAVLAFLKEVHTE